MFSSKLLLTIVLLFDRQGGVLAAPRVASYDSQCMATPHGPFIFEFCTLSPVELRYIEAAGPNPDNRYAMSAWKNCQTRSRVKTTPDAPECLVKGATKVSWTGDKCLHEFQYWKLAMHTGNPWLSKPPFDWDHASRGVSVMKGQGAVKRAATETTTNLAPSQNFTDIEVPWTDNKDNELPNDKDIPPEHAGPLTFEFCTKNHREAQDWLSGKLLSNHMAAAAWAMCQSTKPVAEGPRATAMCGPGATKIIFIGTDCWRNFAEYAHQSLGDPWLASKDKSAHIGGCAHGIHVKPFLT